MKAPYVCAAPPGPLTFLGFADELRARTTRRNKRVGNHLSAEIGMRRRKAARVLRAQTRASASLRQTGAQDGNGYLSAQSDASEGLLPRRRYIIASNSFFHLLRVCEVC